MMLSNIIKSKSTTKLNEKIEIPKSKLKNKEELILFVLMQYGLSDKFKRNPRTRKELPVDIKRFVEENSIENKSFNENLIAKIGKNIKVEECNVDIYLTPIVIVGTDENTIIYETIKYSINENTSEVSIVNNVNKFIGNALDLSVKLVNKKVNRKYDRYGIEIEKNIYNLEKSVNTISYSDIIWYNGIVKDNIKSEIYKDYYEEYDFVTSLKREDVLCVRVNTKGKYYTYPKNDKIYLINYDNISELEYDLHNEIVDYDVWRNVLEVQEDIKVKTIKMLSASQECNLDSPYFKGIVKLAKKYGYNIDFLLENKK